MHCWHSYPSGGIARGGYTRDLAFRAVPCWGGEQNGAISQPISMGDDLVLPVRLDGYGVPVLDFLLAQEKGGD